MVQLIKFFHLFLLFLFIFLDDSLCLKFDNFTEELLIKPLNNDELYVHFHFTTQWNSDLFNRKSTHTKLFPRGVEELIKRYSVAELHVSLTGGLWRYENWGYPVIDAAPGAEIWGWFYEDHKDVDKLWIELSSSLSGLLCASLNFVHASNTIKPSLSLKPKGFLGKDKISFARYAAFPREIVCTENLTPWKKLLPCGSKTGLPSLLNSDYIHNTRYHSLTLSVYPVCNNAACTSTSINLEQTMSLVYDYNILGTKNWSFQRLFGQGLLGTCPLASSSKIYVDISSNSSTPFKLSPAPEKYITSTRGGVEYKYTQYDSKPYAMSVSSSYIEEKSNLVTSPPVSLYANQYLRGYGLENGGITIKVFNNHWTDLNVVVLQSTPWYVPLYLHTLEILNGNKRLQPLALKFTPGKQRQRPYHLEVFLTLPKQSITTISIDFHYVFLKWQEYPPDANHGFYINSAIVSAYLPYARNFTGIPQGSTTLWESFNATRAGYLTRIRTENIVITLPTPDFSMPYNVICLACTVVALAFGPLHNITTKRLILSIKEDKTWFYKLRNEIVRKINQSLSKVKAK